MEKAKTIYNNEKFDPDARLKVTEAQIDRVQDGRPAIDVVYDTLVEKIDYYNSLIRDAELELKHWKEMKQQLESLKREIDKRK